MNPEQKDIATGRGMVRAAARALRLLDALAGSPADECSLVDLADRTDLPRSTAHRLLASLVRQGYVEKGSVHGTYRLGLRMAILGYHAVRGRGASDVTQGMLERISGDLKLAVSLVVLDGVHAVAVSRGLAEGVGDSGIPFGSNAPAHACASGKALLAEQPRGRLGRTYGSDDLLEACTPNTVHSLKQLTAAVEQVSARQYALDDEEWHPGLRCVSVPVRRRAERVTYALTASGPSDRLPRSDVPAVYSQLRHVMPALAVHLHPEDHAQR